MSWKKNPKLSQLRRKTKRALTQEELRVWTSIPSDLEEKVEDITGAIQRKAYRVRQGPPIDWIKYKENGLLDHDEYAFINALQYASNENERDSLLDYNKGKAFQMIIKAVKHITEMNELSKFLVLVDDFLWEDHKRIRYFNTEVEKPWKTFLELLDSEEEFVQNIASRIVIHLTMKVSDKARPSAEELTDFMKWLKDHLHPDNLYVQSVAKCLQSILTHDKYRAHFLDMRGIHKINDVLCRGVRPQIQYQLCFCLWVASFNSYVSEKMLNIGIIPVVSNLLECCPTEITKLPRVVFAMFRNLLEKPTNSGIQKNASLLMIQCNVLTNMDIMEPRVEISSDPEFIEDFEAIQKILKCYVVEMSTFEEYLMELKTGRLEWSVVHQSRRFWVENAERFNENKYELLKVLLSLLEESDHATTISVAAHDIAEYMKQYVRGKKVIESLGTKDTLVNLLTHHDKGVKYHALKALQVLLLDNYEVMYKDSDDLEKHLEMRKKSLSPPESQ